MSRPGERYRDPRLALDERVDDLLDQMTLDEKVAQVGGVWLPTLVSGERLDPEHLASVLSHGVGHVTRIGASTGLRPEASARLMNEIQHIAVDRTRLGIPVIVHEESTAGYCARDATVFPQAIGLAATWDERVVRAVADVIREQLIAVGARHTLAPVLDVARDPRWGRVEETYGEDPYLVGRIGTAYVAGLQTEDLARGVIATGKHFLGYGAAEGGLNHAPVHLGMRELREVYAEPFAAAIRDAGLASVMNSYSSVDGLPCAGSRAILSDLLRDELGFSGVVVADYYSVTLLRSHHRVATTRAEAAVRALEAGLDLELPAAHCFPALKDEVADGRLDVAVLDRAVRRVLESKFRLGLFDNPYVDEALVARVFDTPAQRAVARTAAGASLVLLTNSGVLPLDASALREVAVIGPAADDRRLLQGDYHYPAHVEFTFDGDGPTQPPDRAPDAAGGIAYLPSGGGAFSPGSYFTPHVTPVSALREALPDGVNIRHVHGCDVDGGDDSGIGAAVAAAQGADVGVVFVGGRSGLGQQDTVGEARDASNLRLTGHQQRLVDAVTATGTPIVVVVVSGRVHALNRVSLTAAAVLLAWCPGEEGGNAIADVLLGHVSPSGRLPVTIPRSVGHIPSYHGHRAGGARSMFYGDYVDAPVAPLFPFGHGLSYTSFSYGDLDVRGSGTTGQPVELAVTVVNTGDRAGHEVVQLYARDDVASVARPDRLLVGFSRIYLEPAASARVAFTVHPSRLAFYNEDMDFVVEPGTFTFSVGASSTDLRATVTVDLTGGVEAYRQREIVATEVRHEHRTGQMPPVP